MNNAYRQKSKPMRNEKLMGVDIAMVYCASHIHHNLRVPCEVNDVLRICVKQFIKVSF